MKIIPTLNQARLWRSALILALLALTGIFLPTALAAPGDIDPSFAGFSGDGVVSQTELLEVNDIAIQPDGRIVVVGKSPTPGAFSVFRYLPDGNLDGSFGNGGRVIFFGMFTANAVAIQSDGRIVVGGGAAG